MGHIIKLIRYLYAVNKSLSLRDKIQKLQQKKHNLDTAIALGYIDEKHFAESLRKFQLKMKLKDSPKKVNQESKERLQKLAGIKANQETEGADPISDEQIKRMQERFLISKEDYDGNN